MKRNAIASAALALAFAAAAASTALAQSSAPGAARPRPDKVSAAPPPPGTPDKLTTGTHRPRPGDLTGEVGNQKAAKSYCYISESADKCVGWLTACMSPQSGSFSCAAGPGDNGQYVCVCVH